MSEPIQPFRIEIPPADVEYLQERLASAAGLARCPKWGGSAVSRWAT